MPGLPKSPKSWSHCLVVNPRHAPSNRGLHGYHIFLAPLEHYVLSTSLNCSLPIAVDCRFGFLGASHETRTPLLPHGGPAPADHPYAPDNGLRGGCRGVALVERGQRPFLSEKRALRILFFRGSKVRRRRFQHAGKCGLKEAGSTYQSILLSRASTAFTRDTIRCPSSTALSRPI